MDLKTFFTAWGLLLASCIIVLLLTISSRSDGLLHLHAFAIGQGDSMLIRTPHNRLILIDGGVGTDILTELPKALGPLERTIDLLVITHHDMDHIGGLADVLPRYQIKQILTTSQGGNSLISQKIQALTTFHNIPTLHADPQWDIQIEPGLKLDILFPWEELIQEHTLDKNNSSVSLRLIYGGTSFLLTGDLEAEGEQLLLATGAPLRSTLFKLGHHGSKTSSTKAFLTSIQPRYTLIQYGANNSYGHPHQEVVNRVAHTEIYGSSRQTVHLRCTNGGYCESVP